jgi:uncharacterized membrane protein YjgN (DUF898 family)
METDYSLSANDKRFQFHGSVGALFKIFIINALLTLVTLGFYYPWARAAMLQYFYRETELEGSTFQFHGTGKEMFFGMLKAVGIFIVLGAVAGLLGYLVHQVVGILFFYLALIALIPFAIVGSLKYRYSRSSYRGIYFGYRGTAGNMAKVYLGGIFLTIITFGIYGAWLMVALQREITKNSRFGSIEFEFVGDGGTLFGKFILGYIFTILSLGIYSFWYIADLHNYFYNNTRIIQDGKVSHFHSTQRGGDLLVLGLVNGLAVIFTLGLAIPWTIIRNHRYHAQTLTIVGPLDLASIQQTEASYSNATGDALVGDLNLDLNVI